LGVFSEKIAPIAITVALSSISSLSSEDPTINPVPGVDAVCLNEVISELKAAWPLFVA